MLCDDDLEEIVRLIEERRRHLERIDGIEQQFRHTSDVNKTRQLLARVEKIEEQLREFGLCIDTIGSTN